MISPTQPPPPRIQATLPGAAPNSLDSIHLNAYLEYAVGDYAEASKILADAIRRQPEESAYHFDLGLTRWKGSDFVGAASSFARAGEIDPSFADAFYNAGLARDRSGDESDAKDHFRQARRADVWMGLRRLADVTKQFFGGHKPEALERYGWRIPTKDFPVVLDAISYGLMRRGEHEKAATLLQKALALEVTAKRHAALGTVYNGMKNQAEARRHFEIALDLEKAAKAPPANSKAS